MERTASKPVERSEKHSAHHHRRAHTSSDITQNFMAKAYKKANADGSIFSRP